jgi:hypothetical protein
VVRHPASAADQAAGCGAGTASVRQVAFSFLEGGAEVEAGGAGARPAGGAFLPPPHFGADTRAVLREVLGYSDEALAELEGDGAVFQYGQK